MGTPPPRDPLRYAIFQRWIWAAVAVSLAGGAIVFAFLVFAAPIVLNPAETRQLLLRSGSALVVFLAVASHGVLDAFTDGGAGIMLLWPFDGTRVFWPLRPIEVAPLSIPMFFSEWGASVIRSEMRWVWLPVAMGLFVVEAVRRATRRSRTS